MTVKELKAALNDLPDEMRVFTIDGDGDLVPATETTVVLPQDTGTDEGLEDDRPEFQHGYIRIS